MTDREKLTDLIASYMEFVRTATPKEMATHLISNGVTLPVRCKDCKHNNESRAIGESGMWCDYWGTDPDPDDFCRWGERSSDENLS